MKKIMLFFLLLVTARLFCSDLEQGFQEQRAIQEQFLSVCIQGDIIKAEHCLEQGADINACICMKGMDKIFLDYETALISAACRGDVRMVAFLLIKGANVNQYSVTGARHTALIGACWEASEYRPYYYDDRARVQVIKLLLVAGASADAQDNQGDSALMHAVSLRHKEIVELLIKGGANVNLQDSIKYTPLMRAVKLQSRELVTLLLEAGADVAIRDFFGSTALIGSGSDLNIVALLLEKGACIDTQDNGGRSALIEASHDRYAAKVVAFLMQKGADCSLKDKDGNTALHVAAKSNNVEAVQFLLSNPQKQEELRLLAGLFE